MSEEGVPIEHRAGAALVGVLTDLGCTLVKWDPSEPAGEPAAQRRREVEAVPVNPAHWAR